MSIEKWKPVAGFEGRYEVSNKGRVRNAITKNLRKLHLHHSGYYNICLKKDQKPKYLSVARLVAIAFIPNPENKREVNHKNGIHTDDRIENLEWVTPSENILHYYYKLDKGPKRSVIKKTLLGEEVGRFNSISNAIRELNNSKARGGNITMCCQGIIKYAYGFKWEYAD